MHTYNAINKKNIAIKTIFPKIPYPVCGISLGFAALGNLLLHYSESVYWLCGMISLLLLFMLILKILCYPAEFYHAIKNPVTTSSLGAFPMVCMLLSVYAKPVLGIAAFILWLAALTAHIALILYFSIRFISHLHLETVYASYYLIYTGIAMAAVTAPKYSMEQTGIFFWIIGCLGTLLVSVLLTIRHLYYPQTAESAKPLSCMLTAPVSILLIGYIQSWPLTSFRVLICLFVLAQALYVFSLIKVLCYIKLPFYPSFSAFSFPFVVSAMAGQTMARYLENLGCNINFLSYIVTGEMIIAIILLLYTFGLYLKKTILSN